jgi:hypothetical protein
VTGRGHKGIFWDDGKVVYLVLGDSYIGFALVNIKEQ